MLTSRELKLVLRRLLPFLAWWPQVTRANLRDDLLAGLTGALIVLERDIGLREYIETGTKVEARVSAPLLVSIFTPPGPLHDGAAIIVSSHLLHLVEEICSHILILKKGRKVIDGTIEEIRAREDDNGYVVLGRHLRLSRGDQA